MLDKAWIDRHVRGNGIDGELLFICMCSLVSAIGAPRQAISFLAGYAFGFLPGVIIGVLSTTGGCVLSFSYARWLGRSIVEARHSDRIRRIDDFLYKNTFNATLLIRLLPAGSNLLTNLAAGVSHVRPLPLFAGSALGYVPQTAVFALIGSGINLYPTFRIGFGIALFVVSGLLGIRLYRRIGYGEQQPFPHPRRSINFNLCGRKAVQFPP